MSSWARGSRGAAEGGGVETIEVDPHLSQMSTEWSMVFRAHSGSPDEAHEAASRLMCRYGGAVHRYLLKALRDPDAARELDQEFALRFLRGDFKHSDPNRGRFRDYVKRAVQNLINDYYRRKRPLVSLDDRVPEPAAADAGLADFEQQFIESWRKDLLDRAWASLEKLEKTPASPITPCCAQRSAIPTSIPRTWRDTCRQRSRSPIPRGPFAKPCTVTREIRQLLAHRSARQPPQPVSRRSRAGTDRIEPTALLPAVHETAG